MCSPPRGTLHILAEVRRSATATGTPWKPNDDSLAATLAKSTICLLGKIGGWVSHTGVLNDSQYSITLSTLRN